MGNYTIIRKDKQTIKFCVGKFDLALVIKKAASFLKQLLTM